ncbi:MAG: hypothetical protein AB7T63_00830 [Planctomycetota bacterium]
MRRLLAILLVTTFGAALLPPQAARADDVDAQAVEARRLGRRLLAHDPARRVEALGALFELLEGAPERRDELLAEATGALADWADRSERLAETWERDLAEGDPVLRSRAARLLAALVLERGARAWADADGDMGAPLGDAPATVGATPGEPPTPSAPRPLPADLREHRLVDTGVLVGLGATSLDVRTFLMRHADASQVVDFGSGLWMVLADPEGHARLAEALAAVARGEDLEARAEPTTPPAAGAPEPRDGPPAGGAGEAPPPAAEDAAGTAAPDHGVDGPRWKASGFALRVPHAESGQDDAAPTGVRTGTLDEAAAWLARERKRRDAREMRSWTTPLAVGAPPMEWRAGREIPYNRSIVAVGDGAYRVDSSTLHEGYAFSLRLVAPEGDPTSTRLVVEASRTDVVEPLTELQVRPAADAEPLTVHRARWTRSTRTETVDLAPAGGVVVIGFDLPAGDVSERVILVLTLTPPDR